MNEWASSNSSDLTKLRIGIPQVLSVPASYSILMYGFGIGVDFSRYFHRLSLPPRGSRSQEPWRYHAPISVQ